MKFTTKEIEKYLALLGENVVRIQACTAAFDEAQLTISSHEGEWSTAEILGHLRACAEVWSNSIYAMLAQENPTLPDIHPRRWARARRYELLTFSDSFNAYRLDRQELLRILSELSDKDWSRTAEIGGRTHSVFSQVRRMAKHETEHCSHIEELLVCEWREWGE